MTADWPGGVRHVGDVSPICCSCAERGKACPDTAVHDSVEGEREPAKRLNRKGSEYRRGDAPADRPVVAQKPLLGAVGVEPRGRVICGGVRSINRELCSWEESHGCAEAVRQAV